mmetsp:Transcript_65929/g.121604  ORF Transcript_65929/g.121604 Transcript_65929/m.121604 type:complete len:399 (+) Transcript_65929:42-1238(+)
MTLGNSGNCSMSADFSKMQQCIHPVASGLGRPWFMPPSPGVEPNALLTALFADHVTLQDVKAQIGSLIEMSVRQAEQTDAIMQQLNEQAKYMSATTQAVGQVQSQVNAMRNELIDVCRGTCDPRNLEYQVRRNLEARRGDSSIPLGATQVGGLGGGQNTWEVLPIERDASVRSRGEVPPGMAPGAAATAPSTATVVTGRKDDESPGTPPRDPREAIVPPSMHSGFIRSPPGLSLWSESLANPEQAARRQRPRSAREKDQDVAAEMTSLFNLVTSGETEICLEAVNRASSTVINKADNDGMTALHYAAMHGRADVCLKILGHPRFKSMQVGDRNSNTAMHIAALHDQGEVCQVILAHDPTAASAMNRFGDRPMDIAIRRGDAKVRAAFEHCLNSHSSMS